MKRFFRRSLALVLFLVCGACGSTTALGIHWGCNPDVQVCAISSTQIDALASAASGLADASNTIWKDNWVIVNFEQNVIQTGGEQLCGATTETDIEVMYAPIFAPESALLHELYHEALYLTTGNYDSQHKNIQWRSIESIKQHLRSE